MLKQAQLSDVWVHIHNIVSTCIR